MQTLRSAQGDLLILRMICHACFDSDKGIQPDQYAQPQKKHQKDFGNLQNPYRQKCPVCRGRIVGSLGRKIESEIFIIDLPCHNTAYRGQQGGNDNPNAMSCFDRYTRPKNADYAKQCAKRAWQNRTVIHADRNGKYRAEHQKPKREPITAPRSDGNITNRLNLIAFLHCLTHRMIREKRDGVGEHADQPIDRKRDRRKKRQHAEQLDKAEPIHVCF